jgi:chorismate dehydratase
MHRIGSVSYLNSKPLIEGLDAREDVSLQLAVPARLLELLEKDVCDVALLPVIDYQRRGDLVMVPAGCIGADGAVLTVQVFGRVPMAEVTTLALDRESHTSNALARIILGELYQRQVRIVEDVADADARVVIGDKVVTAPPPLPYQVDLGEKWKELTGLPFVFAAWMGRRDLVRPGLAAVLRQALQDGRAHLDEIVARYATPHGWPPYLARHYLGSIVHFDLDLGMGSPQRRAVEHFHELAAKHGLIPAPPRALEVLAEPRT